MFALPSKAFDFACLFVTVCLLLLAILLAMIAAVHAQDAMPLVPPSTVDVGPLVNTGVQYLSTAALGILTALAGWAFALFKKKTGWAIDASVGAIVDQGLNKAVDYAAAKLKDRAAGGIPIDVKSQAVAMAATYVIDKLPDALAHFGIGDADHPKLAEMIESRLESWLVDPKTERMGQVAPALSASPAA